ncbi:phenylpropionate dioxygenase [Pollutimonas nitritireducens]|uniref:Phenylpropionate dioxygenase n=1 Tax=Pollutimonas nitritireducens TaxID=2045209 RepID=A0A2N4ULG0_9BURK|nr:aromatic-ring-hydroxylating dioxygenase subunit beta [Pollutimonas nitritireducens]PLC55864.1 phenylpropionate dioxygenase [Pollutimonas nitritireducens]
MSPVNDQQLFAFVYREARLLDEQQFEEWLALFTDDGHYWMPLTHGQTDPLLQGSLMYEDKLLLRVRVERLAGQRTYSQQPRSRSHHLVQQPTVETDHPEHKPEQGQYVVRAAFHYVESRQDLQTIYAGWSTFELITVDSELRITQKRVDLVNCDAALRSIQLFM